MPLKTRLDFVIYRLNKYHYYITQLDFRIIICLWINYDNYLHRKIRKSKNTNVNEMDALPAFDSASMSGLRLEAANRRTLSK